MQKNIFLPLLPGIKPATFDSRIHHTSTELSLLPYYEKKRDKKDQEIQLHDHGAEHREGGCVLTGQLDTQVGYMCVCGWKGAGGGQVILLRKVDTHAVFVCPTCHTEGKRPHAVEGKASEDQGSTTAQPQPAPTAPPSGSDGVDTDNLGKGPFNNSATSLCCLCGISPYLSGASFSLCVCLASGKKFPSC